MAESLDHLHEAVDRKSILICIGNSDDKLTQEQWANYVRRVNAAILDWEYETHFVGGPSTDNDFQNYAWIVEVMSDPGPYDRPDTMSLWDALDNIRVEFGQDSILFAEFKPDFISRPRKR